MTVSPHTATASGWWQPTYLKAAHYFRNATGRSLCQYPSLMRSRTTAAREPLQAEAPQHACALCLARLGRQKPGRAAWVPNAERRRRLAAGRVGGEAQVAAAAPIPVAPPRGMPPPLPMPARPTSGPCAACGNRTTYQRQGGGFLRLRPRCAEMEMEASA